MDPVRAVADAVLYEGYVLWPYRRSATKNARRWTFGCVFPPAHAARHPDDRSAVVTEVLAEDTAGAAVDVRVRFLHVVQRRPARREGDSLEPVEELELGGRLHLPWEEATEREVRLPEVGLSRLVGKSVVAPVDVPGGTAEEPLDETAAVVRSWEQLRGKATLRAGRVEGDLVRVSVRVENETGWAGETREEALRRSFCSTHVVLHASRARFLSLTDPPEDARRAAAACRNEGVWPVLVGEEGERSTLLAAPIVLCDYPRVAPESPGDLFDATEIDQLLILSILGLSDAEKAEARASDPRAREILERVEALTPEQLMRLHGAIRDVREVPGR